MPSSQDARGDGDKRLLSTWRQEGPSGGRAKALLILRRLIATVLAVGLIGALGFWLFRPLMLPRTYFVYLGADDMTPLAAPPVDYVYEDFAGYADIDPALSPLSSADPSRIFMRLASPKSIDRLNQMVQESSVRASDTLIFAITAHGLVRNGQPYLASNDYSPTAEADSLAAVGDLLESVEGLPGGQKIVLLDSDRLHDAPRLGVLAPHFVDAVRAKYEELTTEGKISSVYVLCANSPGERSHVSRWVRRSVFGYAAAAGLLGEADLNGDNDVQLDELQRYLAHNVSEWVKTASDGVESQTPMLLSPPDSAGSVHLLYSDGLPKPEPSLSAGGAKSRESILSKLAAGFSTRVGEFGVPPATLIANQAEKLADGEEEPRPRGDDGESEADPNDADLATDRKQWLKQLEASWALTNELAAGSESPSEYAPHLWRRHLARLIWLEARFESGELEPTIQSRLASELRATRQSLQALAAESNDEPVFESGAIAQIHQLRPRSAVPIESAPTLALAERAAGEDWRISLGSELRSFVQEYDEWLDSPREGFERLDAIAKRLWEEPASWEAAQRDYYEFYPLGDLRRVVAPADLKKRVLATRRLGERAASDLRAGQGWAAEKIDRADRSRLEAERLLADQTAANWRVRVGQLLEDADDRYREAEENLAAVRELTRLRDSLAMRVRDYVHWAASPETSSRYSAPTFGRISALVDKLSEADRRIDPHRGTTPTVLNDLTRDLRDLQREFDDLLQANLSQLTDGRRIEPLLRTALLSAEDRVQCLESRTTVERERMGEFRLGPPPPNKAPAPKRDLRMPAFQRLAVERKLAASLALGPSETTLANTVEPVESLPGFAEQLQAEIAAVPADLSQAISTNFLSVDREQRREALQSLRRVARALALASAADSGGELLSAAQAPGLVRKAEWLDLVVSLRDRRLRSLSDAEREPIDSDRSGDRKNEYGRLEDQAASFERIAEKIAPGVMLDAPSAPRIVIDSITPLTVELDKRSNEEAVDLTIKSTGRGPEDVWVVAQYDSEKIAVEGDGVIAEQRLLRQPVAANAPMPAGYPYHPLARGQRPTLRLPDGATRTLSLRVKRLPGAGGNATLVVKVIGSSDYLRRRLSVRMPGREVLRVTQLDGDVEKPLGPAERVFLYANRVQPITLVVTNAGDAPRTLVATLYAAGEPASAPYLPAGVVDSVAAAELMGQFGRYTKFAQTAPIKELQPKAKEPLVFEFDAPAAPAPPSADAPPEFPLKHGLLLKLEDRQTRECTIRWLRFEVWKPRKLLNAVAEYDLGRRELRVVVQADPRDGAKMPPGKMRATLVIDERFLRKDVAGDDSQVLEGPSGRCVLTALLNGDRPELFDPDAGPLLPAHVDIDGYPRAFRFLVPKGNARGLAPDWETTAVRMIAPENSAELSERQFVRAVVEVDAPDNFFNNEENSVLIGVDNEIPMRTLTADEETKTMRSDRSVAVFARPPAGGGSVALRTKVDDFRVDLRTEGIRGQRLNILAEVRQGRDSPARDWREITLDGMPPEIRLAKIEQRGEKLVVIATLAEDLTGVKSVEAAIERTREDKVEWVKGKPSPRVPDEWNFAIPLDFAKVRAGANTLLMRATDDVNNTHEPRNYRSFPLTLSEAADPGQGSNAGADQQMAGGDAAGEAPKPVLKRVSGRIGYGQADLTETKVTLEGPGGKFTARIQSDGKRYVITKVPPGDYVLSAWARGPGGTPVKRTLEVTVSDSAGKSQQLKSIALKLN